MLRREFPFKISVAGSPSELMNDFIHTFIGEKNRVDDSSFIFQKKMEVNNVAVRLHIKVLTLENQFTSSRLREFQGSIGIVYIFGLNDIDYFNSVKIDLKIFEQLYRTVEVQPVFLSIGTTLDPKIEAKIKLWLSERNFILNNLEYVENVGITQLVRTILSNSKFFLSTTQGSCDIDLS